MLSKLFHNMKQIISWLAKAEKATETSTALIVNSQKALVNSSAHVQTFVGLNVTLQTDSTL